MASDNVLVATAHVLAVSFVLAGLDLEVMFADVHLKHDQSQYPGFRKAHKLEDTKFSHWSIGSLFTAFTHGFKDVELIVETFKVEFALQPLHVLSHRPPKLAHKPSAKTSRHCAKDSTLRLFAQRSSVLVEVEVVLVVLSHPLHVRSHCF